MTISLEKAIAGFNNRLLGAASRMNRMGIEGMGGEIERAARELGTILGADHVVMSAHSPNDDIWEPVFSSSDSRQLSSFMARFPSNLSFILKELETDNCVMLDNLPEGLPPGAAAELDIVKNSGLRSLLVFSLKTDGIPTCLLSYFFPEKQCPAPASATAALRPALDFIGSAYGRFKAAFELEKMTRFEGLLDEISSAYINIPVDDIDRAVTRDLERLCRFLDADRYNILILEDSNKNSSQLLFSYTAGPENNIGQFKEAEDWIVGHGGHGLFRHITEICLQGQVQIISNIEDLPENEETLKQAMYHLGVKSHLAVPVSVNREVIGLMIIVATRKRIDWSEELIRKIRQFGDLFANAYVRKRHEEGRRHAHEEIKRLKARLESDYRYLSDEFRKTIGGDIIAGGSPAMGRVMNQVMQVAPTQTPVLLLGETGAGKGMLALALHQASRRADRPLVQLNCATLASGLIENELFGHERGAFTGADRQRAGRFEIAEGTTLFLDEIGELPAELQAKLLRVLETGEFERLGGSKTLKTNARIIVATNRDLEAEVAAGRFRRDLWYRLNIFPIRVPPLRERINDIPIIADEFLKRFSKHSGKRFAPIPQNVMDALKKYPWPGNVRELQNLIERAVIVSPGGELCITVPQTPAEFECAALPEEVRPFAEMERMYLLHALKQAGWRVEGKGGAADILDLNPSTLRSRMRKLGIRKVASTFE
jgi:transcriptional regulator with GAF, ATPase, and Fis domain